MEIDEKKTQLTETHQQKRSLPQNQDASLEKKLSPLEIRENRGKSTEKNCQTYQDPPTNCSTITKSRD